MNFTEKVKAELTEKSASSENKKAYLSGFLRGCGSVVLAGGKFGFEFSTESAAAAKYAAYLFEAVYSYSLTDYFSKSDALNKKERITFECTDERSAGILRDLDILTEKGLSFGVGARTLEAAGAKKAFLKGRFVGAGNITVPRRRGETKASTGYHLEFVLAGEELASAVEGALLSLGMSARRTLRKGSCVVYVKSAEDIKDFLVFTGASKAALELTDIMIEKEVIGNANRQKNCDLANVTKQMDAAEKVIAAIEKLENEGRLGELRQELRETAEARRIYAEDTLQELSERLGITKSCLNHRLRKILEIEKRHV